MITFNDLVQASPQISDKLLGIKEIALLAVCVFIAALIIYSICAVFECIYAERQRRKNAPWIPIMEAQSDELLKKDLDKLVSDSRLPTSYRRIKLKNLDEQYKMVDDFMRIIRKRKIKEK